MYITHHPIIRIEYVRRNGGRGRCTHFGQGQGRTPLVLQNIQADTPVRVNVAMVDFGAKVDLGSAQAYPCPVEKEVT